MSQTSADGVKNLTNDFRSTNESPQFKETRSKEALIVALKEPWQPNDIIRLFHEERNKVRRRGDECKQLLEQTNSVLKDVLTLRDLYSYISPKTSPLHSECKNIIQERNDLRESYQRINDTLSKKEELRSVSERMPENDEICNIM